jgi:hypothetical protein
MDVHFFPFPLLDGVAYGAVRKEVAVMTTAHLLPLYTEAERSRELRMHSYIMRCYAQRTRAQSIRLRGTVRITRQYSLLLLFFNAVLTQQEPVSG